MRKPILFILVLITTIRLSGSMTSAAPFQPLFIIRKITGRCSVCPPDSRRYIRAIDGKAYLYGTKIKTGRESSVIIEFSLNNQCRVLANASLAITEDVKDKRLKKIQLDEGKIEVTLEENYQENGDRLNVETAIAICGAIRCEFSVNAMTEQNMKVMIIKCEKGQITVYGPHFEIPLMEKDDWVSISTSLDRILTKVRNEKGKFEINLKDSEGNPKTEEMEYGSVVKIYRILSDAGDKMIVAVLIITPKGNIKEIMTYTEDFKVPEEEVEYESEITEEDKAMLDGDWLPAITFITPTPVGRR